jgi:hypothetical protein
VPRTPFVKRDTFVHHQGADNTTQYPIKITYFDGLGRALEVKIFPDITPLK